MSRQHNPAISSDSALAHRHRWWPVLAFSDLDGNVRASVEALAASPYLRRSTSVRGFVDDIATGAPREVVTGR
ncbi:MULTISPECIES: hypothetical protein [unclassified Pseudofrankia]|uniref:hypothetical protein n=1 Tax=unclassified Pseudofrankia TaxID=2994372 RepID=UPI0010422085|nr:MULTISPECIES: hypothetical protein [unclassified Pseudofrankia]MDT3438424.1 hypothetical protein [Pseudofrankia sp. BMG5.37]